MSEWDRFAKYENLTMAEREQRCHRCGHIRGEHYDYHSEASYCHGDDCYCGDFIPVKDEE